MDTTTDQNGDTTTGGGISGGAVAVEVAPVVAPKGRSGAAGTGKKGRASTRSARARKGAAAAASDPAVPASDTPSETSSKTTRKVSMRLPVDLLDALEADAAATSGTLTSATIAALERGRAGMRIEALARQVDEIRGQVTTLVSETMDARSDYLQSRKDADAAVKGLVERTEARISRGLDALQTLPQIMLRLEQQQAQWRENASEQIAEVLHEATRTMVSNVTRRTADLEAALARLDAFLDVMYEGSDGAGGDAEALHVEHVHGDDSVGGA
jgi:polyhydroxyalkanoate synthesis regulator phasin